MPVWYKADRIAIVDISMSIKLYNSLTKKKQTFKPADKNKVGLYTCGPTVYNYAHIGNLRSYVFADILRRALEFSGLKVKHVMNITDVGHLTDDADQGEDKIEAGAKREGKTAWEIAKFYERAFADDIAQLNIKKAHKLPKATTHIKEQIKLIEKLMARGHVYTTDDGLYFDTSTFPKYGVLIGKIALKGLQEGARVDKGDKKNPTDFALWKFSQKGKKRQMQWDSPWGVGFPGWHIECSAMSQKYLGETFDIHTGGIDHVPVHHTNEIAQSQAATGKPLARFWLHGEHLVIDKGRMGKSEGNFITLSALLERGYDPLAYRYYLLQTHYRKQLSFTWEALDAAASAYQSLIARIAHLPKKIQSDSISASVEKAFFDDLSTPQALAAIWKSIKSSNPPAADTIFRLDQLFGLNLKKKVAAYKKTLKAVPSEVIKLVKQREEARKTKKFTQADKIRELIEKKGWTIEDTEAKPILLPKK